jgi:hypothetical protein
MANDTSQQAATIFHSQSRIATPVASNLQQQQQNQSCGQQTELHFFVACIASSFSNS